MIRGLFAAGVLGFASLAPVVSASAHDTARPPPPAPAPLAVAPLAPGRASPLRFAPEVAHFATLDAAQRPPECAILFVGSSSIRFWRSLETDMAPHPVINRGFGGARIYDVDYYFDQVVTPYRPRAIFFYAGENDLWAGESAEAVVSDFRRFMDLKTARLGETPVYFISIKPSKLRLSQMALQAEVNQRIRVLAEQRPDLDYVDVTPAMMEQGVPKDIYIADGLHMTHEGYSLWTSVLRPVVERAAMSSKACPASPAHAGLQPDRTRAPRSGTHPAS